MKNSEIPIKSSLIAVGFLVALLAWGIASWPDAAHRRCALMPGFCKTPELKERQPLEALKRPEQAKFKLSQDN